MRDKLVMDVLEFLGVVIIAAGIALLSWTVALAGIFLVACAEFAEWRAGRAPREEDQ